MTARELKTLVIRQGLFTAPRTLAVDRNLTDVDKAVAIFLACCDQGDGLAGPSNRTLAAGAGCSVRTVIRSLGRLAGRGYVSLSYEAGRGRKGKRLVRLNWPQAELQPEADTRPVAPGRLTVFGGDTDDTENGRGCAKGSVSVSSVSPNPRKGRTP